MNPVHQNQIAKSTIRWALAICIWLFAEPCCAQLHIASVRVQEENSTLELAGSFGTTPGTVQCEGVKLEVLNWFADSIKCRIADTGSGSVGSLVVSSATGMDTRSIVRWSGLVDYSEGYSYLGSGRGAEYSNDLSWSFFFRGDPATMKRDGYHSRAGNPSLFRWNFLKRSYDFENYPSRAFGSASYESADDSSKAKNSHGGFESDIILSHDTLSLHLSPAPQLPYTSISASYDSNGEPKKIDTSIGESTLPGVDLKYRADSAGTFKFLSGTFPQSPVYPYTLTRSSLSTPNIQPNVLTGAFNIVRMPAVDLRIERVNGSLVFFSDRLISSIQLFNLLGQEILAAQSKQSGSSAVDIRTLMPGMYFVKVTTADSIRMVRFIKE